MSYDPKKHHRRSIRLKGYDYANSGYYFVTICVQNGKCVLGEVVDDEIILNDWGQIVANTLAWLEEQYDHVILDEWMIMPNHIHFILIFHDTTVGAVRKPPEKRKPLGRIIGAFKTVSSKEINNLRNSSGTRFWQRDFYEHIIRNDRSLQAIRDYIRNNPANWNKDKLHPNAPNNQFNQGWQSK